MGSSLQALPATQGALPKLFTQADLLQAIHQAARSAAKETASAMEEAHRRSMRQADPGRAAQRMLSEYRRLKIAQQEDIQITEAEGMELRFRYLEDLMGTPDRRAVTEDVAYLRERRLQYNAYKLQRIEAAMSMYRRECENTGGEEAKRRCRVVWTRYMEEQEYSAEKIAEIEDISVKTVYKDLGIAHKALAMYLSAV